MGRGEALSMYRHGDVAGCTFSRLTAAYGAGAAEALRLQEVAPIAIGETCADLSFIIGGPSGRGG
jgi:hypothetical protein